MNSLYKDVSEFHEQVLKMEPRKLALLEPLEHADRVNFILEELHELNKAYNEHDLIGAADAIADLVYVALGTAYCMGLPFDAIWEAVHEANMAKVSGMTKRGMRYDAIKPIGWRSPEPRILAILNAAV
jgi:hypothetical protein